MPRSDTSKHGGYHIDQRGRVVERRVSTANVSEKNCGRCVYHTPIGNKLICRKLELPTDIRMCYGNTKYFIEVSNGNEET